MRTRVTGTWVTGTWGAALGHVPSPPPQQPRSPGATCSLPPGMVTPSSRCREPFSGSKGCNAAWGKEITLLGSGCFVFFPSAVPFSLVTRHRQTLPVNPSAPAPPPGALRLLPQPPQGWIFHRGPQTWGRSGLQSSSSVSQVAHNPKSRGICPVSAPPAPTSTAHGVTGGPYKMHLQGLVPLN